MAETFGPVLLQYYFVVLVLVVFNISTNVYSNSIIKNLPRFRGDLPFKLETGYIGVGEKEDVQLFYYFVESERNPKHDPLMIWIPGGPGCSATNGLLYEMGPFTFEILPQNKLALEVNPYSWTKVANVIFLDTPVGTGFSYGKNPEAYKSSDTIQAEHVYNFLRKWLNDHPKYISNPLYIAGVSYAGIIIPIITRKIYNGNEAGNEPQMNIKGYVIGNPLTDREIDFNSRIPYANHFALLSDQLFESVKRNCHGEYIYVDPDNVLCANDLNEVDKCLKHIYAYQILEPSCDFVASGAPSFRRSDGRFPKKNPISPLQLPNLQQQQQCQRDTSDYSVMWANDEAVQRALHIREGTVTEWKSCNTDHYSVGKNDTATYSYDVASTIAYHRNLTDKRCRALIFSGDHDMVFPYLGTIRWIETLNLTIESTWAPWFVEYEVAGYGTTYSRNDYSLTFATVKGAGHVAPKYKPKESLAMVDRWLDHYSP